MDRAALFSLARDGLIGITLAQRAQVEAQAQQVAALAVRIAGLEAKLANPVKAPCNPSLPPSKGQKPNLPALGKEKPRPGRPGAARALAEHPGKIIEATLAACPRRDHAPGRPA